MRFLALLVSFVLSCFADYVNISDFAFMLSQKEKVNVVFDKSVEKNITIYLSDSPNIDYIQLFGAALKANGLDQMRIGDTLVVTHSKVNDIDIKSGSFGSPSLGAGSGMHLNSVSSSFGGSSVSTFSRDNNASVACKDCTYEPLKLDFLNYEDLNDFLRFSGVKAHYVKNINTLIFEVKKDDNTTIQRVYDVIKSLDVPKNQVQIRLTIFENNLNKLSDIGFNPSLSVDFSALSKSGALFKGDMVGKFYGSLRFLETQNVTKVTNSPSYFISNLNKLEFKSVLNMPFLDENFAFSYQGTNQSQKYKYKPVGFKLELIPTIIDNLVYVDLNLAFESVVSGGNLPTTSEKSIKNKFMLRKGDIVLLAGIEKSSLLNTKEGLPLLANIPFLSGLFSHSNDNHINETFNIAIEVIND